MFGDIIYEIPEDTPISKDIQERALAYMEIGMFGRRYYVPITKQVKRLFKLKMRKGRFVVDYDTRNDMDKMFHDSIRMVQMQIRHDVAGEAVDKIMRDIRDGFDSILRPKVEEMIERKVITPALSAPEEKGGNNGRKRSG
jgi:hypothetical protein